MKGIHIEGDYANICQITYRGPQIEFSCGQEQDKQKVTKTQKNKNKEEGEREREQCIKG